MRAEAPVSPAASPPSTVLRRPPCTWPARSHSSAVFRRSCRSRKHAAYQGSCHRTGQRRNDQGRRRKLVPSVRLYAGAIRRSNPVLPHAHHADPNPTPVHGQRPSRTGIQQARSCNNESCHISRSQMRDNQPATGRRAVPPQLGVPTCAPNPPARPAPAQYYCAACRMPGSARPLGRRIGRPGTPPAPPSRHGSIPREEPTYCQHSPGTLPALPAPASPRSPDR